MVSLSGMEPIGSKSLSNLCQTFLELGIDMHNLRAILHIRLVKNRAETSRLRPRCFGLASQDSASTLQPGSSTMPPEVATQNAVVANAAIRVSASKQVRNQPD